MLVLLPLPWDFDFMVYAGEILYLLVAVSNLTHAMLMLML